ncbi:MAG TPA: hypothetical protein VHX20_06300 [Terracidiphilus sp.]|jgi:hypothetical protein|nr:hypothetical protein [Terracidiphilus sp.]
MDALERKALAYAALQRLWVTLDPASAEIRWQQEFAFMNLPAELKAPGHWYQHQGDSGYIEYYPSGDAGEFHAELPAGIDAASIIIIPQVPGFPSIYEDMKGLLLDSAAVQGDVNVQRIIADMDELRSPTHASRIKSIIAADGFGALASGKQAIADDLAKKLQAFSTVELQRNKVTGFEAAAVMLLYSLYRQLVTATPAAPANLIPKMFDPSGVSSLQEMTARFIHDCCAAGMGNAASQAIDDIRLGGDATLAASRSMLPGNLDPGVYLDSYYAGLQQAALRFLAVRWGWQSVLVFAGLSDDDRQRAEKRVNAVEEKLVRCETALMYAVKDLDGSRYRQQQQAIRDARAAGDEEKADAVLSNVFDSVFFYPEALKDVMSKGA